MILLDDFFGPPRAYDFLEREFSRSCSLEEDLLLSITSPAHNISGSVFCRGLIVLSFLFSRKLSLFCEDILVVDVDHEYQSIRGLVLRVRVVPLPRINMADVEAPAAKAPAAAAAKTPAAKAPAAKAPAAKASAPVEQQPLLSSSSTNGAEAPSQQPLLSSLNSTGKNYYGTVPKHGFGFRGYDPAQRAKCNIDVTSIEATLLKSPSLTIHLSDGKVILGSWWSWADY